MRAVGYLFLLGTGLFAVTGYQQIAVTGTVQTVLPALLGVSGIVLLAMTQAIVTAAISLIAVQKQVARPASVIAALRDAMRNMRSLATMMAITLALAAVSIIMAGIPIVGAMLAPGLLVFVAILSLIAPAIITVEQLPAPLAAARAWGMVRRYPFRVFAVMATFGIIAVVVFGLPAAVLAALGLPLQLTDVWLPLLPGVFYAPLLSAAALLLYVDLRSRTKGELTWQLLWRDVANSVRPADATPTAFYVSPGHGGLITLLEAGQLVVVSMLTAGIVALLAIAGGGVLLLGNRLSESQLNIVAVGTSAPDFSLNTLTAQPVSLQNLRGKPAVINFWATWCPPCREELPALEAAHVQYGDRVNFLAVSVKEDEGTVRRFADQFGLTLPVLLDGDGAVMDSYQVRGLPTTLFINAEGVIVSQHVGGLTDSTLADYLQPLLETEDGEQ